MKTTEIVYEICDGDFESISLRYPTREEAEAELRKVLRKIPTAFLVRSMMARVVPRQPQRLKAV